MGKKRRQYTKEFKVEAVRLVVEEGRRISEVARELGISVMFHQFMGMMSSVKRSSNF